MNILLKNIYNIKYINRVLLFILISVSLFFICFLNSSLLADNNSKEDLPSSYYNYSDFDITAQEFVKKLGLSLEEEFLAQYNPSIDRKAEMITEDELLNLLSSEGIDEFIVHMGYNSPYLYPSYVLNNTRDLIRKHSTNSIHLVYLSSYTKLNDNFSSLFIQALQGSNYEPSQRFIGVISKKQLDALTNNVQSKIFSLFDKILVIETESRTLYYTPLEKAIEVSAANPNILSTKVYMKEGGLKELAGVINSLVRLSYSDYDIVHNVDFVLQTGFNPKSTVDIEPIRSASLLAANLDKVYNITSNVNFTIKYHEEYSYFSLFSDVINNKLYSPINSNNSLQKSSLINRLLQFDVPDFDEINVSYTHDKDFLKKKIIDPLNSGTLHYDNESARFITGADSGIFLLRKQDNYSHKLFVQLIFSKSMESWVVFASKNPIIFNINGQNFTLEYSNLKEISADFLSIGTTLDLSKLDVRPDESLRINAILNFVAMSRENTSSDAPKLLLKFVLSNENPVIKVHSDIVNYLVNRAFYFRLLGIKDQIFLDNDEKDNSLVSDSDTKESTSYVDNLRYNPNIKYPVRIKNKIFKDKQSLNQFLTTSISFLYSETRSILKKINTTVNTNTSSLDIDFGNDCTNFFDTDK